MIGLLHLQWNGESTEGIVKKRYCNGRCKLQIKEFNKENCLGGSNRRVKKQNTNAEIFSTFTKTTLLKTDINCKINLCSSQGQGYFVTFRSNYNMQHGS